MGRPQTQTPDGLCPNTARAGSMYCDECAPQLSPEKQSELERRFGRARLCRKCGEMFRAKDSQNQCMGCRTFG